MIALYIAPLLLALLILELRGQLKYYKRFKNNSSGLVILSIVILFGFSLMIPLAILLPSGRAKNIFAHLSNYWLGVVLYILIGLLISNVVILIYKLIAREKYNKHIAHRFKNIFVLVFAFCMSLYGILNAHTLRTTVYDINSSKKSSLSSLDIVLVSDLHLGVNVGEKEIMNMVSKINTLNPDIVVLAGDIFDNDYSAIRNPDKIIELLNSIKSRFGKFVVYGNHDVDDNLLCGFSLSKNPKEAISSSQMDDFIAKSGFTFLYDRGITVYDEKGQVITYIYGRPDATRINFDNDSRVSAKEITSGYKGDYFFICVDHEPSELVELADAGVDLDLSGHTHNGQLWPGTLLINLFWNNPYGLLEVGDMTSIVTSGVGLFGPDMRVGSNAEVVNINVFFH